METAVAPVAPNPASATQAQKPQFEWQSTEQQLPPSVPGKYDPTLPQWQEWRRRNKEDKKWEWKTPIAFYGRVVDQNNNPVAGAKVVVSWTDLSATGTSVRELHTDGAGNFTLSGERGKHLLVRSIEKVGYEDSTLNQDGFEYAAFFDENYHIPDPNSPVLFRMHMKAVAEPLVAISDKFKIQADGTVALNLRTSKQGRADANILVELLDNSDPTGRKWVAKVSAPGGGIQPVNDEFATIAPESGYQSEITINQDTPQPGGFQSGSLYKGGKFYVKTSVGYALVEFRMIPGNKSVRLTSYLNPNTNSRNLEFDPAKAVKSP